MFSRIPKKRKTCIKKKKTTHGRVVRLACSALAVLDRRNGIKATVWLELIAGILLIVLDAGTKTQRRLNPRTSAIEKECDEQCRQLVGFGLQPEDA